MSSMPPESLWPPGTRVRLIGIVDTRPAILSLVPVKVEGAADAIYVEGAHLVDASMPEDDPASGHGDWGSS